MGNAAAAQLSRAMALAHACSSKPATKQQHPPACLRIQVQQQAAAAGAGQQQRHGVHAQRVVATRQREQQIIAGRQRGSWRTAAACLTQRPQLAAPQPAAGMAGGRDRGQGQGTKQGAGMHAVACFVLLRHISMHCCPTYLEMLQHILKCRGPAAGWQLRNRAQGWVEPRVPTPCSARARWCCPHALSAAWWAAHACSRCVVVPVSGADKHKTRGHWNELSPWSCRQPAGAEPEEQLQDGGAQRLAGPQPLNVLGIQLDGEVWQAAGFGGWVGAAWRAACCG